MPNNAQKTPFARTMNRFAEKKVLDALQLAGKGLPCEIKAVNGSIVTVSFDVDAAPFTLPTVTVPTGIPEYTRIPFQVGDKGLVVPASARLGGISGLGAGTASLSQPANLSALLYVPVSNSGWFAVDADLLVMYGPNGVQLRTVDGAKKLTLNSSGITIDGDVVINGDTTINGKLSNTDDASLGGGAKKVVLDGDAVVGGFVVASSTKTKAT